MANAPFITQAPPVKCLNCGDNTHLTQACLNKLMKCTKYGRAGHIGVACSFPTVQMTGIPSTSAQPRIAATTATLLPS
jgi:hypothetical protein